MSKKKTLEDFKRDLEKVWGDRYTVSPNAVYKGNHEKVEIVCKKHGRFMIEANAILHKHGCKECRRETIGKDRALSQEEVINRLKKTWADKYDLSEIKYVNARTKITPICKIHGKFETRFSDFENFHGCPFCNESNLENEINSFLINNKINFKREYKDYWLKNGSGFLKLDFYLPDYNVAIECQGKQHYTEKSKYGGNGEFEKIKERDKRKNELCKKNGISLYYYTKNNFKGMIPEEYRKNTFFDKEKMLGKIVEEETFDE